MATPAVTESSSIQSFTSSEPGAWSNSYLISGRYEAILFDVFMLRSDAEQLADGIAKSGKSFKTVMVSHAHPDHFMGLEVITERWVLPGSRSKKGRVNSGRDEPWARPPLTFFSRLFRRVRPSP